MTVRQVVDIQLNYNQLKNNKEQNSACKMLLLLFFWFSNSFHSDKQQIVTLRCCHYLVINTFPTLFFSISDVFSLHTNISLEVPFFQMFSGAWNFCLLGSFWGKFIFDLHGFFENRSQFKKLNLFDLEVKCLDGLESPLGKFFQAWAPLT